MDIKRIIKGNPWIIRNMWFVVQAWERGMNLETLEFNVVPVWVQMWGLPMHCLSVQMASQLGEQLGEVLEAGVYEFPDKAKAVKVKVLHDISKPLRAGMYIGNEVDGITWLDFRFENLPLFCFNCGLVGHKEDLCVNNGFKQQGGEENPINPMGPWLRSKTYGKRMVERHELKFSSNPRKSLSGGQFSPIPKELLDMMANIKLQKAAQQNMQQEQELKGNNTVDGSTTNRPSQQMETRINSKEGGVEQWGTKIKMQCDKEITMREHGMEVEFNEVAGLVNKTSQSQ